MKKVTFCFITIVLILTLGGIGLTQGLPSLTERERNIKVDKYKPPLPASCFKKEAETSPLIEVTIPAFTGPDQGKPWVGVLRRLTEVGYY